MDQEQARYVVRSWTKGLSEHFGISPPMTKRQAKTVIASFKEGNQYLETNIEKYTRQKAEVLGTNEGAASLTLISRQASRIF
jgi:hypothetical protein